MPWAPGIDMYSCSAAGARVKNTSVCVDTPDSEDYRRISIPVEALQRTGDRQEPMYSLVERLVSRGPEVRVSQEQEFADQGVALSNSMLGSGVGQLYGLVRSCAKFLVENDVVLTLLASRPQM